MRLPVDGVWKVDHSSDRGLNLLATKNISFDKKNVAELSPRSIVVYGEDENASFETPYTAYIDSGVVTKIATEDTNPFSITLTSYEVKATASIDALANQPSMALDSSGITYNGLWCVAEAADLKTFDGSAWTDRTPGLSSGFRHPMAVHEVNNSLLIGNGPAVKQYNTSFTSTTDLTLPAGHEVIAIAYNSSYAGIITLHALGTNNARLYIWDGATTGANYSYPIDAHIGCAIVAYGDGFAFLNGKGRLMYWGGGALQELAGLPSYYTTGVLSGYSPTSAVVHDKGIIVEGDTILINMAGSLDMKNSEPSNYNPLQPSGIWCYDPSIGLYHKYAWTGAKAFDATVTSGNVNTGTDTLTIGSGTVPETGTPVWFASGSLTGMTAATLYYTIKTGGTTFKVATTYANALLGTAVDITGVTGTSYFTFLLESDFGQEYSGTFGGMIGTLTVQVDGQYTNEYFFGARDVGSTTYNTNFDRLITLSPYGENRGYIVTQKMYAGSVTDNFQKVYVKSRNLKKPQDKVIVKYRTEDDSNFPKIVAGSASAADYGTWTDANTFTTQADLSNVTAGMEVEFIRGAGSGYLAHISSISYSAPTYTVNIDEDIRNIAASDTCWFIIDNWKKGGIITTDDDKNYVEIPIYESAKWVQLKVELRGYKVGLEEIELINSSQKSKL